MKEASINLSEEQHDHVVSRYFLRRQVLGAAAGIATQFFPFDVVAKPPNIGLKSAARAVGLNFGSAVRATTLDEPSPRALLVENCAILTPELEMKWDFIEPRPGELNFAPADRIAVFAWRNRMRLRGHTLLWHRSVPDWLGSALATAPDWRRIERHIETIVSRYRSLVDEWDVVNEPIDPGARPDGLRETTFLQAFGPDYILRALEAAHASDPKARLIINEYGLEYNTPRDASRRAALLSLARSLVKRGAPLHGIGVQAHLDLGNGMIAARELGNFLSAIADLGLSVSITELDVKERDYIKPAARRDRLVADHVAQYLAVAVQCRTLRSISCWGLSWPHSWLEVDAEDRARFPGGWSDGTSPGLNRGLPFDGDGRPTPMRDAIANTLAARR